MQIDHGSSSELRDLPPKANSTVQCVPARRQAHNRERGVVGDDGAIGLAYTHTRIRNLIISFSLFFFLGIFFFFLYVVQLLSSTCLPDRLFLLPLSPCFHPSSLFSLRDRTFPFRLYCVTQEESLVIVQAEIRGRYQVSGSHLLFPWLAGSPIVHLISYISSSSYHRCFHSNDGHLNKNCS